jgi:hypothetical protein
MAWIYDIVDFLFHWPPNVGFCIALIGVVAIIMTTRADLPLSKREKIIWIIVSFVLLLGEVYAMQSTFGYKYT